MNRLYVRTLAVGVALCLLAPLLLWLSLQLGDRSLVGLRVEGKLLPESPRAAERALRSWADEWEQEKLVVRLQESDAPSSLGRAELGASLPVEALMDDLRELGRSGNPLLDLHKWWLARRGRLSLRWSVQIDVHRLAAFVEAEQLRVEEPPMAGVSDGHGFSLPGRDGRALDRERAMLALRRALSSGAREVTLPLQRVPAPAPLQLGSPDGALFEEAEASADAQLVASVPAAATPVRWQAARADDCYAEPPHRPFCDGPRRVPEPYGPAQELAQQLGLGRLETVGALLRHAPKPEWIRAAGGPRQPGLGEWPVALGKLGRGYGFVRRAELRDRIHAGLDIVAPRGAAIRAITAGVVAYADNRVRGYGNLLVIVHDTGQVSLNAHCERVLVFAGQRVERGQLVAEVGMTGLAMGPHLHLELRDGGQVVDPLPQLRAVRQ